MTKLCCGDERGAICCALMSGVSSRASRDFRLNDERRFLVGLVRITAPATAPPPPDERVTSGEMTPVNRESSPVPSEPSDGELLRTADERILSVVAVTFYVIVEQKPTIIFYRVHCKKVTQMIEQNGCR